MSRGPWCSALLPSSLALLLTACPASPPGGDGGADANTSADALDAGAADAGGHVGTPDAGGSTDAPDVTDAGAALFTRCATNQDCGDGRRCNQDYPGGLCTRTCRNDADCGPGACFQGSCRPRCRTGTDDCAQHSGLCFVTAPEGLAARMGLCFPSCAEVPTMGRPGCGAGRTCNPYTGLCAASVQVTGALNGSPCATGADCASGRCRGEFADLPGMPMAATGFHDGYCVSLTLRPDASEFVSGRPLPRAGCPAGSVVSAETSKSPGSTTQCWRECRQDGDCRAGYRCWTSTDDGSRVHATGACLPIDCSMAGMTCPAGSRCEMRSAERSDGMTIMYGVCARGGDAGAGDAGSDASVTDGGDDSGTPTDA